MKYRVKEDCHWKFRYWDKDEIVNLADHETPPEHFEPFLGHTNKDVIEMPPEPITMSQMNKAREAALPNTGMAHKGPGRPRKDVAAA